VRLDKYLKVTRIVKRRNLAQQLCNGGHVKKNGRTAKPSTNVDVGDIIEVNYGSRKIVVEVTGLAESADKKTAPSLYKNLSSTDVSNISDAEALEPDYL